MALFGKQSLHTAQDIMDTILTTGQMKEKEGAVEIQRKEGRKTVQVGTLYFRNELVYAAHVEGMPVPIYRRITTGQKVDDPTEMSAILRNVSGDESSPDIVRRVLVNHLLSEKTLDSYVKEHFLDHVAEIMSWNNCTGTWLDGVVTKDFTMPNVSFRQLKAIVAKRNNRYQEFAVETSRFFNADELPNVTPVSTTANANNLQPEVRAVLALSAGTNTITDIAVETGLGIGSAFQMVHALWRNGNVSLRLGEINISYSEVSATNNPAPEVEQVAPVLDTPVIEIEVPVGELNGIVGEGPSEESLDTTPPEGEDFEDEHPAEVETVEEDEEDEEDVLDEQDEALSEFVEGEDIALVEENHEEDFFEDSPSNSGLNDLEVAQAEAINSYISEMASNDDVDSRLEKVYATLGIDRIEYDESDSVDIEPFSIQLPTFEEDALDFEESEEIDSPSQEDEVPDRVEDEDGFQPDNTIEDASSLNNPTEDDNATDGVDEESEELELENNEENVIIGESEPADESEPEITVEVIDDAEEVEAEEVESADVESFENEFSDSNESKSAEDEVSEVEEGSPDNPEDFLLADTSPTKSLPELMKRLEDLRGLSDSLEEEMTSASQLIDETEAESNNAVALLERSKTSSGDLEKLADGLRSQYEEAIEKLEVEYSHQQELSNDIHHASQKAQEAKTRRLSLETRKERILDAIEKTVQSFSAR